MVYPVTALKMPADLVSQPNGRLPDQLLVPVKFAGRTGGRLHLQAARGWWAMVDACRQATGVTLTVTSLHDAYRIYDIQLSTFLSRYDPVSLATYLITASSKRRKFAYNGKLYWKQRAGVASAAVPGTSNHGWGLAVDACELLANGASLGIASSRAWTWLLTHAHEYGFSWEVQTEPWHIRYVLGDAVTDAIRAFEAGGGSTPPQLPPFDPINQQWGLWPLADKPRIGPGAKGDLVKYLQGVLRKVLGGVAVDGDYGPATTAAVQKYQALRHLTVDGWVGPITWAEIDKDTVIVKPPPLPPFIPEEGKFGLWPNNQSKPKLEVGASGDAVRYLQGVLKFKASMVTMVVDGSFGPMTRDAVIAYQRQRGLAADGVVGPMTWAAVDADALK